MKKFIKNILLQIIAFIIAIIFIGVFAALYWPSNNPTGESSGGNYIDKFNKIFQNCPDGNILQGYDNTTGNKICIIYN